MRGQGSISDLLDDPPVRHDGRDQSGSASLTIDYFRSIHSTLAVDHLEAWSHCGQSLADRS